MRTINHLEDKLASARMSLGDARQQAAVAAFDLESGLTARQEEIDAVLEQARLALGVMSGELTLVYDEADLATAQGESAIAELFATTATENARIWSDAAISLTHAVGEVSAGLATEADYQGRLLAGYGQVLSGARRQIDLMAGKLREQSELLRGAEEASRAAELERERVSLALRPREFERVTSKLASDFLKEVAYAGIQKFLKTASTVCSALSVVFPALAPVAWTMTFANLCIGLSRAQNMTEALGLVTDLAKEAALGVALGTGLGVAGRLIGNLASTGAKALKAIPGLARTGATIMTGLAKSAMGLAGKAWGVVKRLVDCFPAGTQVVTGVNEDGSYQTTSIENLQVGDLVLARDQNNASAPLVYKPVTQTFASTSYVLVNLEIADDATGNVESIRATLEHPFYVEGIGWKQANTLAAGDHVQMPDGAWARVQSATIELHAEGLTVYNLEVADAHTYFVEDGQGAQSAVWVHNASTKRFFA